MLRQWIPQENFEKEATANHEKSNTLCAADIKTYTIPADQDPATLIEEPFELEGFLYTFANIVKTENPIEETKEHTEVVTIETSKKDLSVILENLEPTIEYDDGIFKGTLALDHTSIVTEAGHDHKERQDIESCQCGVAGYRHRSCG